MGSPMPDNRRRAGGIPHPAAAWASSPSRILRRAAKRSEAAGGIVEPLTDVIRADRKSTRLNSSHSQISYAVFCLKKKNTHTGTNEICCRRTTNQRRQRISQKATAIELHIPVARTVRDLSGWALSTSATTYI